MLTLPFHIQTRPQGGVRERAGVPNRGVDTARHKAQRVEFDTLPRLILRFYAMEKNSDP